ncbi:class I SAM-dependent methyltransferase [Pedobacter aquatilis]|uniref:class I SAM-dependent methyltransferase n=1 Tax=Pedobacter aquatilis TaxID=351343 RepID=UPI002930CFBB|nr:class I SAM-dependent methyltransferase [Pedobacter aquatilis]
MDTRDDKTARLSNINISKSNSLYLHYHFYHEKLFSAIKRYINGDLIDIGCGNKPCLETINPLVTKYIGCDIIQSSNQCVDVLCPANDIPLAEATFDTVFSSQTIEHVEDHQGLVNEAYRLLKPNGYFVLTGPMYWPLHEEPHDFFRFTKHGFRHILEKAGFEIIEINSNGGKWAVAGQALLHAVYPAMYNVKGIKGKLIKSMAFLLGGIKTINRIFTYLDTKNYDPVNTMNYVIVARKNNENLSS